MNKEQFLKVFGERLKYFRDRAGMTQSQLATSIGLSAGAGAISQIEKGVIGMEPVNIVNAAKTLKIHPAALLTNDELTNEELEILSEFLAILALKDKTANWGAIKTLIQKDTKELA
jgi:transcriptional regulator with XRE-family HTH domain